MERDYLAFRIIALNSSSLSEKNEKFVIENTPSSILEKGLLDTHRDVIEFSLQILSKKRLPESIDTLIKAYDSPGDTLGKTLILHCLVRIVSEDNTPPDKYLDPIILDFFAREWAKAIETDNTKIKEKLHLAFSLLSKRNFFKFYLSLLSDNEVDDRLIHSLDESLIGSSEDELNDFLSEEL